MTQTPNFQLNQWSGTDYVRRTDFNADNLKIDTALGHGRLRDGAFPGLHQRHPRQSPALLRPVLHHAGINKSPLFSRAFSTKD